VANVVLKNITKKFDKITAVNNVNLEVKDKEFCVLVGPSGCGKSTTLRMIAGLEEITKGEIWIEDRIVNDIPPKDRDIAMVFQNYALYPHMKTYDNMAFGLRLRGYSKGEIDQKVSATSDVLGIRAFLQRLPKALSGGQRQRVAVGRAIVRKPKVFLFDEPLSNLDAKLRAEMRTELKKLHERLQSTIIYVTHDQIEALTLGTKIVVLKDGIIQQIADPLTLYHKPDNRFVAEFIGSPPMNFMEGKIIKKNGSILFTESKFKVKIPVELDKNLKNHIDREVIFGIRPEDLHDKLHTNLASTGNTATVSVDVVEPLGNETLLHVTTGSNNLIARTSAYTEVQPNQTIEVVFDMKKAHLFDKETDMTIV
jgi:multiple sugar transport system ATP-binding protein